MPKKVPPPPPVIPPLLSPLPKAEREQTNQHDASSPPCLPPGLPPSPPPTPPPPPPAFSQRKDTALEAESENLPLTWRQKANIVKQLIGSSGLERVEKAVEVAASVVQDLRLFLNDKQSNRHNYYRIEMYMSPIYPSSSATTQRKATTAGEKARRKSLSKAGSGASPGNPMHHFRHLKFNHPLHLGPSVVSVEAPYRRKSRVQQTKPGDIFAIAYTFFSKTGEPILRPDRVILKLILTYGGKHVQVLSLDTPGLPLSPIILRSRRSSVCSRPRARQALVPHRPAVSPHKKSKSLLRPLRPLKLASLLSLDSGQRCLPSDSISSKPKFRLQTDLRGPPATRSGSAGPQLYAERFDSLDSVISSSSANSAGSNGSLNDLNPIVGSPDLKRQHRPARKLRRRSSVTDMTEKWERRGRSYIEKKRMCMDTMDEKDIRNITWVPVRVLSEPKSGAKPRSQSSKNSRQASALNSLNSHQGGSTSSEGKGSGRIWVPLSLLRRIHGARRRETHPPVNCQIPIHALVETVHSVATNPKLNVLMQDKRSWVRDKFFDAVHSICKGPRFLSILCNLEACRHLLATDLNGQAWESGGSEEAKAMKRGLSGEPGRSIIAGILLAIEGLQRIMKQAQCEMLQWCKAPRKALVPNPRRHDEKLYGPVWAGPTIDSRPNVDETV